MNNSQLFDTLRKHRPLLLACEAIGWLHMTGKAKAEFLRLQGGEDNKYEYKKWYSLDKKLLDWIKSIFNQQNAWPEDMTNFFTKHTNKNSGMLGLLQAAHGIVSGVEKNIPSKTSEYLRQNISNMWLSSAFGKPEKNLLGNPPVLTDDTWEKLMSDVQQILRVLEKLGKRKISVKRGQQWRNGSTLRLKKLFKETIAETRIPNNDVTLWDQSYVAAALFKSAVAGAILQGDTFKWDNGSLKQESQWRLLTVGIGTEHYESRAVKIGDWTGAEYQIQEFFKKVNNLIEVDLAVGSLLYKNSEVWVFSFPDVSDVKSIEKLEEEITKGIDKYAQEANLETPPYCKISEKPSRSLICMTEEIKTARDIMTVPTHRPWKINGGGHTEGHVCPVCLVRRNGKGSNKGTLCDVCKDRKDKRQKNWLQKKDGNTIWIGEVADKNDRLALVTMSLDIEPWLDGSRLDSLRAQAISEWSNNSGLKQNPIKTDKPFDSFLEYTKKKLNLNTFNASDNVFSSIHEGFKDEQDWSSFFFKIVEDRTDGKKWEELDEDGRAKWFTHQFFRKLASPGRIYRFQQQTEEFFSGLLADFRSKNENRWRTRRLVLKPDEANMQSWEDGQVYNSHFGDAPLDLVYRKSTNDFLIVSNLARIDKPKETLQGKTLKLTTEDEDGDKTVRDLVVQSVEEAKGTYRPVIHIEISPVRFRVLVPLENVSGFVDDAIEKWQTEFSRVWDRLPLRVGVVACKRKTPFQSVIEMTRTVEEKLQYQKKEEWKVEKCESFSQEEQKVPLKFEDGREDVFYPYFAVEADECCCPLDFQHPEGQVYRHVKDLKAGDSIRVCPSQIATVFMDDMAVRFEPVEKHGLMDWKLMREMWKSIKESIPSQTALRGAWAEVAERRVAWQNTDGSWMESGKEAWLDFARIVFFTRLKVRDQNLCDLVQAAEDDLLEWILEWHITVLKEKITEDK